jgi:hypothetical protein
VVLELVVGELARRPQFLDRVPVAAGGVDAQGGGPSGAALAFVVAGLDDAADLVLAALDVVGDRIGGDNGSVLVRGVDEVALVAADVVLGVGQPLDDEHPLASPHHGDDRISLLHHVPALAASRALKTVSASRMAATSWVRM